MTQKPAVPPDRGIKGRGHRQPLKQNRLTDREDSIIMGQIKIRRQKYYEQ